MSFIKKLCLICTLLCMVIVLFGCGGTSTSQESQEILSVIKDGISGYQILIPEEPSPCEEFGASELQSFLRQVTGATLPIVSENALSYSKLNKIISLGNTSHFEKTGLQMQEGTREDAYAITNVGRALYLYGNSDRAVLYSVYEFLEDYAGVRFLAADYTYVPQQTNVILTIPVNQVKDPVFDIRAFWTADVTNDALYAARKGLVGVWQASKPEYGYGMYRDFNAIGHNTQSMIRAGVDAYELAEIPDSVYATDLNGNRLQESINETPVWDICWSNGIADDGSFIEEVPVDASGNLQPTVAQLLYYGMIQQYHSNPTATYLTLQQEDTTMVCCNCPTCNERATRYGASSANVVRMINAVANKLQEYSYSAEGDGRDIKVVTIAYVFSQQPPVLMENGQMTVYDDSVIPNEDVLLQYCTMNYCNHALSIDDARQSSLHQQYLDGWGWLCREKKNMMIYTYTTNFNCTSTYAPNLRTLQQTTKYCAESFGNEIIIFEGGTYTDDWQQALKAYIASELMWDLDADVKALEEEYITLFYGRSAPVVQAYIDRMEALADYNRATYGNDYFLLVADHTTDRIHNAKYWPLPVLEQSIEELKAELETVALDETLSYEEKARLTNELEQILLAPLMQINFQYNEYYGSVGDYEAFSAELLSLITKYPKIYDQAHRMGLV